MYVHELFHVFACCVCCFVCLCVHVVLLLWVYAITGPCKLKSRIRRKTRPGKQLELQFGLQPGGCLSLSPSLPPFPFPLSLSRSLSLPPCAIRAGQLRRTLKLGIPFFANLCMSHPFVPRLAYAQGMLTQAGALSCYLASWLKPSLPLPKHGTLFHDVEVSQCGSVRKSGTSNYLYICISNRIPHRRTPAKKSPQFKETAILLHEQCRVHRRGVQI